MSEEKRRKPGPPRKYAEARTEIHIKVSTSLLKAIPDDTSYSDFFERAGQAEAIREKLEREGRL